MSKLSKEIQFIFDSISDDIALLTLLHDREITEEVLQLLKDIQFPHGLAFVLAEKEVAQTKNLLETSFNKEQNTEQFLEDLATDYADIYLNYSFNASPFESVWLDEENLLMQAPMFEIRKWYEKFSLKVVDWRVRSDDHFVCQLQFVAQVLQLKKAKYLPELTNFLDEHLFRWFDKFCAKVANRCATSFYASLMTLRYLYINAVRDFLTEVTGIPRPSQEEIESRFSLDNNTQENTPQYIPGASVSW